MFIRFFPKKPDPPGVKIMHLERCTTLVEAFGFCLYVSRTGIGLERTNPTQDEED
ncbi:MAG: hypothetical protein F6K31_07220 [Symploca sp. SIO2G7]|nr:hypothetical protein [Symploca sp. SIO2G7]